MVGASEFVEVGASFVLPYSNHGLQSCSSKPRLYLCAFVRLDEEVYYRTV